MTLQTLTPADLIQLLPYFQKQTFRMSDYTGGYQLMWQPYGNTKFAIVHDCLILQATFNEEVHFYYPLHQAGLIEAEIDALVAVERYCVENELPLRWTSVPQERLGLLTQRYGRHLTLTNPRTWRDYLYTVQDFVSYTGKRFSGQRNHVRKFQRQYPTATFQPLTRDDLPAVQCFLQRYAERQYAKNSFIANEELNGSKQLLQVFDQLDIKGGLMLHEGDVIGVTLGSVANDTIVIHIEKALVEYEGIYPTLAQAFATHIASQNLLYINREDDAGDCGLRKSKLQYNPTQIIDKYNLIPHRMIEELTAIPEISTPRLTLRAVPDEDAPIYARLASDLQRNRYWGWDWRNAWTGEGDPRSLWFLHCVREDFHHKNEAPMGIYVNGALVGEAVFHNFTYEHTVEIGVRLLPEAEENGYATEAMRAMADYALCFWGLEKVTAKCYKENHASRKMLIASGLRPASEDETFYYFDRTAKN